MPEIGTTGLNAVGGRIYEDFLREWQGAEGYKRANEMRLNSPVVAALLMAIEQSVRHVSWSLASEMGEDDPRLEIWDASCRLMVGGLQAFVIESLSFLPFGYALFEIVWGSYEGMTVVRKLSPRSQDTVYQWVFDDGGDLTGFIQMAAPRYQPVEIPIEKLIHLRTRAEKGNPEGRSILRSAWKSYYFCKNIEQIEAIGIERDLAGLPVITLPEGANTDTSDTASDASRAAKLVRNIRQDEQAGVVLAPGWTLSLLSTGGSRQFDTDKIITRYESRILMTALAQFLLLGQQNVGSLALSRDQSDLFVMSVNAVADIIEEALEKQLLPRLMALNGYDAEGLNLTHTPAGDKDIAAISAALSQLAQGGWLTPLPEDEAHIREMVDLPVVDPADIEAARADRLALAQAAMQQAAQARADQPPPRQEQAVDAADLTENGETVDENAAALQFFTSERPDAARRRRFENAMQRGLAAIFKAQKGKIVRAARELRR